MACFLVGEDARVEVVGWAGRVVVGRGFAGWGAGVAGGSRGVGCVAARSGLFASIAAFWDCEAPAGRASVGHGRPTIAIETFVRLMVVKHRTGWGYETLVREVSDSLHLRRFCLIALGEPVAEESTVR